MRSCCSLKVSPLMLSSTPDQASSLNRIRRQMPTPLERFESALHENAPDFGTQIDKGTIRRLSRYYELMLKWNARLHLVAPCSPEEFATRHVLESLFMLTQLQPGSRLIDIGSGGGLPIIPCLIAGDSLRATLIESSRRKAVFLKEAVRQFSDQATVLAQRFQDVPPPAADYVSCRALERFTQNVSVLVRWSPPKSRLLLFGGHALQQQIESAGLHFSALKIPGSQRRFLFVIDSFV